MVYLQYMSELSSKLITSIRKVSNIEFDPYILSNNIADGFWASDSKTEMFNTKIYNNPDLINDEDNIIGEEGYI